MTRFSGRLPWHLEVNELSRRIAARRASGAELLDLTESNPTRAGLAYPASLIHAFDDARALVYDPRPEGLPEARQALSHYYAERGVRVDPARLLLTASTSEAYSYLFKLLCDPGDEVLAPRPSYPLFEFLAGLESVRVVQYPLVYHEGWFIDFPSLVDAITPRTRAVVVVSPNNPTGSTLKPAEWAELSRICLERGLAVICDEVFADYADPFATVASSDGPLAFALSGLSKIAALPQMKLGWIAASGDGAGEALGRLELIADTFLSVATPVQYALPRLMEAGNAVRAQVRERLDINRAALRGMRLLASDGGWYAVLQAPRIRTEEEWVLGLLDACGVLVQPGYFFDFSSAAFLIVSLLTPPAVFAEGIARMRAFWDEAAPVE